MTETQDIVPSPFATLWFSPQETIGRIVSTRPTYMVLPIAIIGTIAISYMELASHGMAGALGDWRMLLAVVLGGAVSGVVGLYLSGLMLTWSAWLLGGSSSVVQLRAVAAWSLLPFIVGSLAMLVGVLALQASGASAVAAMRICAWIMVIVSLWSAIVLMLMLGRIAQFGVARTILAWFSSVVLTLLFAGLLVALPVRALLYQPFNLPSRAMMPTLLQGDYFFVSKFAYGYSRFSLPFSLNLFGGRIFGSAPQRGDVVVFRLPKDTRIDYVKRLMGLPGDRIQMKDGLLYINDVPVQRESLPDYVGEDPCGTDPMVSVKRWREKLPNGVSYQALDCVDNGFYDNTPVFTIPAGQYFMIGDNRDNSMDSRGLSSVGYVPFENLIGRVDLIFYSGASGGTVRAGRIGTVVR
jgi:signal peptidase I